MHLYASESTLMIVVVGIFKSVSCYNNYDTIHNVHGTWDFQINHGLVFAALEVTLITVLLLLI